jgi:methylmalonyl-CoA mutase C-terminal domain/subunit
MAQRKKRVVLAKMGTDGHDLGLKFIASFLRQAGMEVIYLGPYQTPAKVVNTAVQEGVDVIGIGSLSGEYLTFVPQMMDLLKRKKLDGPIKVVLGGLIAKEDTERLREEGVECIFLPGATSREIIDGINAPRHGRRIGTRAAGGIASGRRPGTRNGKSTAARKRGAK